MAYGLYSIISIPLNFLSGFLVGLAAPLAAIAAMVMGVRFLTGRLPFLSLGEFEESGERRMAFELVPSEEARTLFAAEKEIVLAEVTSLQEEVKAAMKEAQEAEA
jgi:hypothetical protein